MGALLEDRAVVLVAPRRFVEAVSVVLEGFLTREIARVARA